MPVGVRCMHAILMGHRCHSLSWGTGATHTALWPKPDIMCTQATNLGYQAVNCLVILPVTSQPVPSQPACRRCPPVQANPQSLLLVRARPLRPLTAVRPTVPPFLMPYARSGRTQHTAAM